MRVIGPALSTSLHGVAANAGGSVKRLHKWLMDGIYRVVERARVTET